MIETNKREDHLGNHVKDLATFPSTSADLPQYRNNDMYVTIVERVVCDTNYASEYTRLVSRHNQLIYDTITTPHRVVYITAPLTNYHYQRREKSPVKFR